MSGTLARLTCEWCGVRGAIRLPAFCGEAGGILCEECSVGPFVKCPATHVEKLKCSLCRGLGVVKELF